MSASRDMSPARRFLGLDERPSSRVLLGLPEVTSSDAASTLKSGQIEAALERRADEIARHPLSNAPEARRLLAQLELAADQLQAEIALLGKGPLHPTAARRAARRLQENAARVDAKPAVVAPSAIRRTGSGLTADDLTDFDRLALALLVVSGGWNAKSAKRLATVAGDHGVSVDDLDRVVKGLTQFLSEGEGLRGTMGDVGSQARSAWLTSPATTTRTDAAEGAVERVLGRINDVIRDEISSGSTGSQARLAIIFGGVALAWIAALAWLFFAPGPSVGPLDGSETSTNGSSSTSSASSVLASGEGAATRGGAVGANGQAIAPVDALATPAKFPRAPGFVPKAIPLSIIEVASSGAVWIGDVEQATRFIRGEKGKIDDPTIAIITDALSSASEAWPAAGAYRAELVRVIGSLARETRGAESLRRLMQAIPGTVADVNRAGLAPWQRMWRGSFGAGVLASIALDTAQTPEVAAAAREEMRTRSIAIPRGQVADAFGTGAVSFLAVSAKSLCDDMAIGMITGLEDASRWVQAVDAAATSPVLRARAANAAIDSALRCPGALDQPGPLVDFLAYSIHMLDYSGRGADAELVRNALSSWIIEVGIPPSRIWVLTSLLDADLGIAWYGPDLVLATNADTAARAQLAERVIAAFPKVGVTSVGEAVLVEKKALESWQKNVALLKALTGTDEAERLRNAAAALAAARVARGFELGDAKVAKAAMEDMVKLMQREATEWNASPTGERVGLPAAGVGDGEFAAQWLAVGRDVQRRIDLIRSLSARPGSGDLGPIDARVLATEALRGNQVEVRQAATALIIDRYANGREMLRALVDGLETGVSASAGAEFLSGLLSVTIGGSDWQAEARTRLIERIFVIEDSRDHAVDAAVAEMTAMASALMSRYGRADGAAVTTGGRADRVLAALADVMRDDAAAKFLAMPFPSSIEEIERLRGARRSFAQSITQRMAAETPAVVDYAAMTIAARQPALQSKISEILAAARRTRSTAQSASAQVADDLFALIEILAQGLAPEASERATDS